MTRTQVTDCILYINIIRIIIADCQIKDLSSECIYDKRNLFNAKCCVLVTLFWKKKFTSQISVNDANH